MTLFQISRYVSTTLCPLVLLAACGGSGDSEKAPYGLTQNQNEEEDNNRNSQNGSTDRDHRDSATPGHGGGSRPDIAPDPCAALGEAACEATEGCVPIYGLMCPAIACDPSSAERCPPSPCEGTDEFVACVAEPPPPLPICPADRCAAFDETTCKADATCEAQYAGVGCACAACDAEDPTRCPPCDCPPPEEFFVGCVTKDPCAALDENACKAAEACEPFYGAICPAIACDSRNPDLCPPCNDTERFLGCASPITCTPEPGHGGGSDGSSSEPGNAGEAPSDGAPRPGL